MIKTDKEKLITMLNSNWHELFYGMAHNGYWFLPTLLVLFVCFYLRCTLFQSVKILNCSLKVCFDIVYVIVLYGALKVLLGFIDQDIASLLSMLL